MWFTFINIEAVWKIASLNVASSRQLGDSASNCEFGKAATIQSWLALQEIKQSELCAQPQQRQLARDCNKLCVRVWVRGGRRRGMREIYIERAGGRRVEKSREE